MLAKLLIGKKHFSHVYGKTIFSSDLSRHWEVIDFLIFLKIIEELVLVCLIIDITKPCNTEYPSFSLFELIMFKCQLDQLCVTFNHLEEKIAISWVFSRV